ncbi:MAG: hypothetical protein GYB41_17890, partial [Oceanospirillales bacterium]|nr:hypothetical protein [Oceanospirillales bacterium]
GNNGNNGNSSDMTFPKSSPARRYTLLWPRQVRYCLEAGSLTRNEKTTDQWNASKNVLMLSGLTDDTAFESVDYRAATQVLQLELKLQTREGPLAFPQQIGVLYEP